MSDQIERKLAFTILDDVIIDDERVGKHELLVYMAICRFVPGKVRTAFPSLNTLAKKARISKSTVQTALKNLEELGYLTKESRMRENGSASSNLYRLTEGGVPQHGIPPIPQDGTLLKEDTEFKENTGEGETEYLGTTQSREPPESETDAGPPPGSSSFSKLLGDMADIAERYHSSPPTPKAKEKQTLYDIAKQYGAHAILTAWTEYQSENPGNPVAWFLEDVNFKEPNEVILDTVPVPVDFEKKPEPAPHIVEAIAKGHTCERCGKAITPLIGAYGCFHCSLDFHMTDREYVVKRETEARRQGLQLVPPVERETEESGIDESEAEEGVT